MVQLRQRLIRSANLRTSRWDALLMPTIPMIAPRIADMQRSDEDFFRINTALLRNCAPFNVLNRPCWSLPCHRVGEAPVGLMIVGETDRDDELQAIGRSVERALLSIRD